MGEPFEEKIIIKNLVRNPDYFLRVIPFLSEELFSSKVSKHLWKCIKLYNDKYNRQPSPAVIDCYVENAKGITDDQHTILLELSSYIKADEQFDNEWILDQTLDWIKKQKFYNAIMNGASEFDKGNLDTELAGRLEDALSVSFDDTIGMEFASPEERWDAYTSVEARIPFRVNILNTITRGGMPRKTLNCFMSSDTGGFKSGTMCSLACDYLRDGKNVLYVSFEMSEKEIMERIDANMLDTEIDNIVSLGREKYVNRITELQEKTQGRFLVKQFPTAACHTGHIRFLLRELKLKKKFVPDVIFVDYMSIMASMRYKASDAGNTYGYVKAVSEELRGLAIEQDVIMWTAMQSNRGGSGNEDLGLTDISDSYGVTFGVDCMIGIVTTPDFDEQHKILYIQLKNRYSDKNKNNKFFLGVNKAKMHVFDFDVDNPLVQSTLEDDEQESNDFVKAMNGRRKKISL